MEISGALVTGAARRLGRAIAERLAAEGWAVAVHCNRSREEAASLVQAIRERGGRAAVVTADLASSGATAALVGEAQAAVGPLGLLVNNASLFEPDAAGDFTEAGFDRHMAVNLRAPAVLARDFASRLGPREGCIVNILDQRVFRLTPDFFTYTLSKAGLWAATQTMAQALAPRVRVNGVGPGPVLANIWDGEAGLRREQDSVPLRHGPTPEEIADTVVFLTRARNVTGQMIAVDGGQHIMWPPLG